MFTDKVFVYGTLKKGGIFNQALSTSNLITDNIKTEKKFVMLHLGGYPGLVEEGDSKNYDEDFAVNISGELYEVSKSTLKRLDSIEGISTGLYYKRLERLEDGTKAWIYFYNDPNLLNHSIIKTGIWKN